MPVGHFPLQDKVVVVTGGGSGIGLSFTQLAMSSGARGVLICDLQLTPPAQTYLDAHPGQVHFMKCDVCNWSDLEAIPNEIENAFGHGTTGDVWVPAAGVFEPSWSSFVYDTEKEDGYKTMRINAEHPIKLTRIAMRSALSRNKPCVVAIVASLAGVQGSYAAALYCASKHAVVGFTKSMRQADVDEHCKVVCILPGMVATPLWMGRPDNVAQQFSFNQSACLTADDVAQAIKDLVEDGKYRGGTLLAIEKGREEVLKYSDGYPDDGTAEYRAWADKCFQPIREVFGKERGTAKL